MAIKSTKPNNTLYHIVYRCISGTIEIRTFNDLYELAKHVETLKLKWNDYAIIYGELIKTIPEENEEDIINYYEDGPESAIVTLPPEELKKLIESNQ